MNVCVPYFTCCFGLIVVLTILGYLLFRWVFHRDGDRTIIRGPWGTRIESEKSKGGVKVLQQWTCTCGETVTGSKNRCPRCGKRSDESALTVDFEDHPEGDGKDHNEDSLIDF